MLSPQATSVPMAVLGVDALLNDFGCRTLDLEFSDDFLLGNNYQEPQYPEDAERWQRSAQVNSAVTAAAAQGGAAVRSVVTTGYNGLPAWKAWAPSDDSIRIEAMDPSSSADSLPTPSPSYPPIKAEPISRQESQKQAQAAKEEERAKKLKEKNRRAQRLFRARQRDKQESAERQAADYAEQLKVMQQERDELASRVKILEQAMSLHSISPPSPSHSRASVEKDEEPTFTPALGWDVFDPTGGIVLTAICNPPRALTHAQMMSLSLRDMAKVTAEIARVCKECLEVLESDVDPTSEQSLLADRRLTAVLSERHAIMAYLAVNNPRFLHRVITSKMSDPPVPNCSVQDPAFWRRILEVVNLNKDQRAHIMEARLVYARRIVSVLHERQQLRLKLASLDIVPDSTGGGKVPQLHLEWCETIEKLKETMELTHRCHCYLLSRVWHRDVAGALQEFLNFSLKSQGFNHRQVAKFLVEAFPYPIDIFAIIKELAEQEGQPTAQELLARESTHGLQEVEYIDKWPTTFLSEEGLESYIRQKTPTTPTNADL